MVASLHSGLEELHSDEWAVKAEDREPAHPPGERHATNGPHSKERAEKDQERINDDKVTR
jgi:hypothetical protein